MPPDIARRLELLTVDVDTLKLVAAKAAAPATFDAGRWSTGTRSYKQTVVTQGRTIEASSTFTLSRPAAGDTRWLAVETSQSPMGAGIDSVWLDAQTLAPVRRVARQGPALIEISARGDSITGELKAGAQQLPIRVQTTAPVYMKGTALGSALGTLPLAADYQAGLRVFDIMTAATAAQRVRVVGSETISVPAGSFETFKVQLQAADGSGTADTYWIEKAAPHRLVRAEQSLPAAAGGGSITTELAN